MLTKHFLMILDAARRFYAIEAQNPGVERLEDSQIANCITITVIARPF